MKTCRETMTKNPTCCEPQETVDTVARFMRDEDVASDSIQDACLLAFRKIVSYQGGSFRNWLARIVVNVCYDELRRQRRRPVQPLEPDTQADEEAVSPYWLADYSTNPERQFETSELEHVILECLEAISPHHRAVLALIDMEEFSYEEAAEILAIPVGTIKSRLARARAEMKKALQACSDVLPTRYHFQVPVLIER